MVDDMSKHITTAVELEPPSSMKALSPAQSNYIIKLLENGHSHRQIHDLTGVSIGSISHIRSHALPTLPKDLGGRPSSLSVEDIKYSVQLFN